MNRVRLFLDCDGVLADFDAGARALLGMTPAKFEARHGRREFWRRIAMAPNFYQTLPEMPDARRLFDAVEHLQPTILTGLPVGNWAAPQKVAWAAEHFPGAPNITSLRLVRPRKLWLAGSSLLYASTSTIRPTAPSTTRSLLSRSGATSTELRSKNEGPSRFTRQRCAAARDVQRTAGVEPLLQKGRLRPL